MNFLSPKTLRNCIKSALQRSVNAAYLPEVKLIYEDRLSYQILWAWSMKKNMRNDRPYIRDLIRGACNRSAQRQYWPALILKKAIEGLPEMLSELERELLQYIALCTEEDAL